MRTRQEKLKRLAVELETCGEALDVVEVCKKLDISEMTLRRYLKQFEQVGHQFEWRQGRILVHGCSVGLKPAMFTRGGYHSFRILTKICNAAECSRETLKEKFCEEALDPGETSMSVRNLDYHLKKLMELGYIERVLKGNIVWYRMCKNVITIESQPMDKILRLLDFLRVHQSDAPFRDITTSIVDKLEGSLINHLRRDSHLLEDTRMLYQIHPDCVLANGSARLEQLALKLETQCRNDVVLEIQTKSKGSHKVHPIYVEYNNHTDEWYLVYSRVESPETIALMKLSRMRRWNRIEISGIPEAQFMKLQQQALRLIKESFAVCLEEAVRIKVFFKDTENVRQILDRSGYKTQVVQVQDIGWIFEDDVHGLNEFHAWLRRFGGDAVVLEPQELRDMHIRDAVRAAKVYWREAAINEGSVSI